MPAITLPHITIDTNEYGSPEGTPVLLLHGFPDAPVSWRALIDRWSGPPVRFIVPALRGYGRTTITAEDARSGEIAALADDALLLLHALKIERAVVVGHDWGARAAYAAAALQPDRIQAVVGLASEYVAYRNSGELPYSQAHDYWYQWFFHTPQGEQSLTRNRARLCGYLWKVWSPAWHFAEKELSEAAEAWNNPQFVATVLSYYRTRYGNAAGASRYAGQVTRLADKPRISVPTWFVVGLGDACNHPAGSLGQEEWFTGGYRRIEVPGVGHFLHREAPDAVTATLVAALEGSH